MKLTLVVASGTHQGKSIPVPGGQFVIGRDEGCHLRPASPAVSKKHCAIYVKDEKAYVRDFGSTNGTFVNDEPVQGDHEVKDGDRLRVGPLDFSIKLTPTAPSDSTPLPEALKSMAPKPGGQPAPAEPEDHDHAAALLLGMGDDDEPGEIPGGSTIMELPSVEGEKKEAAEEKKKGVPSAAETSAAASDILRKYMRRPK